MAQTRTNRDEEIEEARIDPVCGMEVSKEDTSAEKTEYGGKTCYFCSPECRQAFERSPEEYEV
jgi:Cu+-exporting ATPase